MRVLLLRDYNTRVVMLGTVLLGMSAGAVGTFMLLRKRSLIGDVVSHASLPGIGLAFLAMEMRSPGSGKWLPGLLIGAMLAGLAGILATTAIRRLTRVKEDAALAIVLSVFFGFGISLFTIIQNIPTGNAAGLAQFIFGRAASMTASDVALIGQGAAVVLVICGLLFKEFSLLCFDEEFGAARGLPMTWLDLLLMGLVVGVTVIGLQSVGLLLVVAMLIIPATAARFWTDRLTTMTLAATALGGISALLGVLVSALVPRLAAGAVIVLVGSLLFVFSMLFGARHGLVLRLILQARLARRVGRHDLLRAMYECLEAVFQAGQPGALDPTRHAVRLSQLQGMRGWSRRRLERLLSAARNEGLVTAESGGWFRLTREGAIQAQRVARNHRLWEAYLIAYADIAPSHVDREADLIEHVLEPSLIEELERHVYAQGQHAPMPPSPHALVSPSAAGDEPAREVPLVRDAANISGA